MKAFVKLETKLPERSGTSRQTGNPWRSQEFVFVVLREDGSESTEKLLVRCANALFLDSPLLVEGTTGWLSYFANVKFNDKGMGFQQLNMSNWTPKAEQTVPVAAPATATNQSAPAQEGSGLPF